MDTLVPTIQPPVKESQAQSEPAEREVVEGLESSFEDGPPRSRLTLRDAVRLCGMSEKTLRRKLEAGLLQGVRETLDYGGFMWMIEANSLAELYPDSAQLRDYIALLEAQLNEKPPAEPPAPKAETPAEAPPSVEDGANTKPKEANRDFVLFLIDENRNLKEDLRDRDIQLRNLQERSLRLERECGEQRGTATTQARVLEWFQKQPQGQGQGQAPTQAALPGPSPAVTSAPSATQAAAQGKQPKPWLIGLLSGVSVAFLLLFVVQHLFRH